MFKQFGGQLGISSLIGFDVVGKGPVALEPGAQRARRSIDPRVGLLALVGEGPRVDRFGITEPLEIFQLVASDQHFWHVLYRIEAEVPSGRRLYDLVHGSMPGSGTSRIASIGQLDLETAQSETASNWIEAYKKYVRTRPPAPIVPWDKDCPGKRHLHERLTDQRDCNADGPGLAG